MVVIHRLAEIADHPVLHGAAVSKLVRIRRHENRRDRMSRLDQVPVELDSAHSGHLNVGDEARGRSQEGRREEIGRGGERFDGITERRHELSHGFAKRLIVFDDRDQLRCGHRVFNLRRPGR